MKERYTKLQLTYKEPTRGSISVLVLRILFLLVGTDLLYAIINFSLMRIYFMNLALPFDLHTNTLLLLSLLHITKSVFQIGAILVIVLRWIGHTYTIDNKLLIKRDGVFTVKEKICDIDNVRTVTTNQSLLGKLLHYGDIVIETSAPGGYADQIILSGISDPQIFERKISHYF